MATWAPSSSIWSPRRRSGASGEVRRRREGVCAFDCMRWGGYKEREGGKETERESCFKWESRARRRKDAHWKTKRADKKVETSFTHGKSRQRSGEEAVSFFLVFGSFQSHDSKRIPVEITQEELMVSFWGNRAEGRNLNALGWTMPALWIITLTITLTQGERCLHTANPNV